MTLPPPHAQGLFRLRRQVRPEEIDQLGHANNLAYLQWALEAAVAHSDHVGWPAERYRSLGAGFVVRRHLIEYLRPAGPEEQIEVWTWVTGFRGASSLRRFVIMRPEQSLVLARGETLWAFMDFATGRPRRIPKELQQSFPILPDEETQVSRG